MAAGERAAEIVRDTALQRIMVRFPFTEERPTMGREARRVYDALWRTLRTLSEHEQCLVLLNLCSAHVQAVEARIVQAAQIAWVTWWSNDAGWRYLIDDRRDPNGRTGWFSTLLGPNATDDQLHDALRQEVPDFIGTMRRGWPQVGQETP